MAKLSQSETRQAVREYFLCFFGALLVAAGVYFFKIPNNFSTGGVSGISIILGNYFGLASTGTLILIINLALLALGFALCGRDFGIKAVMGTLVFSGALLVLEKVCPLTGPLTDEPLLELIFAVGIPAFGSAVLFNCNGSTGGTEIIALILKKYTGINVGTALLFSDMVITAGAFLFGIKTGLFSVLGLLMKTLVVDSAIENINLCKCFSIITDKPQEISDYITRELHRSTTVIEATGGYTHEKKYVVISAMSRFQAVQLRRYLHRDHPDTFMMITNSSEILGKGFRGL